MALTVGANRVGTIADRGLHGPSPARTTGPAGPADRSPAIARAARTVRSWPLLVLAAPAAAEVWSGWVSIAEKTGYGQVSPLPGIWPSLHLDITITLPIGVEAYAAYALRAWLASEDAVSPRTRRFAKWSAICSFLLGMAGQVASHLLADAGAARAPWAITTVVSCLPVLVLGMGTVLAHMLRADAAAATDRSGTTDDATDHETGGPAGPRSARWSPADRTADAQESVLPEDHTARSPRRDRGDAAGPDTAPAARAGRNARLGDQLPWVATQQVSTHWIRHTILTWVERNFGFAVAQAYAGHEDHGRGGQAMATYIRAGLPEVATALAALTGEPHPLAIKTEPHVPPADER
jgi:hypothetical protein